MSKKNKLEKEQMNIKQIEKELKEYRTYIEARFEQFGFKQLGDQNANSIMWLFESDEFRTIITIYMETAAISFQTEQKIKGIWTIIPFAVVPPLFEVIAEARTAYLVSAQTIAANPHYKPGTANIIKGTEGNNEDKRQKQIH